MVSKHQAGELATGQLRLDHFMRPRFDVLVMGMHVDSAVGDSRVAARLQRLFGLVIRMVRRSVRRARQQHICLVRRWSRARVCRLGVGTSVVRILESLMYWAI